MKPVRTLISDVRSTFLRSSPRFIAAAFCATLGTVGCERSAQVQPVPDDGRTPHSLIDTALTSSRISSKTELGRYWRDAVKLEGGISHALPVTDLRPGDVVRWGLKEGDDAKPVRIRWNDGNAQRFTSNGSSHWQEFSVTVRDRYTPGAEAVLTLESPSSFWLSHAEVVPRSQLQPHVIIVLVDTLRQDHLHCYGYDRETSPNIDAFRKDSVRFTELVPPTSWTRPSVASLLTSTYPSVHGAQDRGDRVREEVTWLADVLDDQGYETHAVLTNPNCIPTWGFGDEFDRAFEIEAGRWRYADSDRNVIDLGIESIEELGTRPLFMYLHAMAPHSPYEPPAPFDKKFTGETDIRPALQQHIVNLYDGEIAYVDSLFGELVATLKDLGVYDSSLVILLSDHGEEFWDHGSMLHGKTLYEEQLRVPFLVKFPENQFAGSTWGGIVEMVDVAPTLLDILDVPAPPEFQGISVAPYVETGERPKTAGYAELFLDEKSMRSTKTVETKYIGDAVEQTDTYFDLKQDPNELKPLREAPDNALRLRQYSEKIAMLGNSGLHILITHDSVKNAQISGTIQSSNLGDVSLRYPDSLVESAHEEGAAYRFSATFPAATNSNVTSVHWQQAMEGDQYLKTFVDGANAGPVTEQNYAELMAELNLDDTVEIELSIDGTPFPREQTHLGAVGTSGALDGSSIRIADIVASPQGFDPAALPTGTAVYVWYIPGPETITDDELDPSLRESLEALGYIGE